MGIISDLFGQSPLGALSEHTKKAHECVKMIRPLTEAMVEEDYDRIHELQDQVSKLEYQADEIKNEIREQLPRRYFLPINRNTLENFLRSQDRVADSVEDFAVILLIRRTKIHESLRDDLFVFVDQVVRVSDILMKAAEQLQDLSETSFGGAEARAVLQRIANIGEEEWKADRLQRKLSTKIYSLENEIDPVTIFFYDKILQMLGRIANDAENTGDLLRGMISRG